MIGDKNEIAVSFDHLKGTLFEQITIKKKKKWVERYFELKNNNQLLCFDQPPPTSLYSRSKSAKKRTMLYSLSLYSITLITIDHNDPQIFLVHTPSSVITLRSPSEEEGHMWIWYFSSPLSFILQFIHSAIRIVCFGWILTSCENGKTLQWTLQIHQLLPQKDYRRRQ